LTHTVNSATRIPNNLSAANGIFVDSTRFSSSYTSPKINSLSYHDAQDLMIKNIASVDNLIPLKQRIKMNNETSTVKF
jgi:hypothetical protein